MELTKKQKELIAKWFRSQGKPDYDGYMGCYNIPEEIMKTYKEMYPNDWD